MYFHVWFQTKRRTRVLLGDVDARIHELFAEIAKEKEYNLMAFETMIDHAHLLLEIADGKALSFAVKAFKGGSARRIFEAFPALRFQMCSNNFWAKRFAAKEIPRSNLPIVEQYIRDQKKNLVEL